MKTSRIFLIACVLCGVLFSSVLRAANLETGNSTYNVTIDPSRTGSTIPSDFVGMSFETETVYRHIFIPSNSLGEGLLQFYYGLGPNGVLRIGGNASDRRKQPLTDGEVKSVAAFGRLPQHSICDRTDRLHHPTAYATHDDPNRYNS